MLRLRLKTRNNCRGYLLTEALISVVIVSIISLFLIKSLQTSLSTVARLSHYCAGLEVAENLKWDLDRFLEENQAQAGEALFEGVVKKGNVDYEFDARAFEAENFVEVVLNVGWQANREGSRIELSSIALPF